MAKPVATNRSKIVFVSGCFDMLHSGHVAFLSEASEYGDLYVGIGSDKTVNDLKGRYPINNQEERKYIIEALRNVTACVINSGSGVLDFEKELDIVQPDIFIVNEDGHTPEKEAFIRKKGVQYMVLERIPHGTLPARSTTSLRTVTTMPFRIDLAGGWLDQPYVSRHFPGAVLTISIEPVIEFNERSGMASSTRRKAIELWKSGVPGGDPEQLAYVLFCYDNPPGTKEFSGSQDALGIVLPGLNRLNYDNAYWPESIETVQDEETLVWLEERLYLVNLGPRRGEYDVLADTRIDKMGAQRLADAADRCWHAILRRDAHAFGTAFRNSFEAQVGMFPRMLEGGIEETLEPFRKQALGWKLSGAGGGGYLILVSEEDIPHAIKIKIRRLGA
jgi:cytidyltransferase-like protein